MRRILLMSAVVVLGIPLLSFKMDYGLNAKKQLNFIAAIKNNSTFSFFTVFTVKDLNTGQVKEICAKGNFLSGAIHKELNLGYDSEGQKKVLEFAEANTERYFEFKNPDALDNISFNEYDTTLLSKLYEEYNFDKIVQIIEKDKEFGLMLGRNEMKGIAHILFNKGYLTGENNCWGGMLEFVDTDKRP